MNVILRILPFLLIGTAPGAPNDHFQNPSDLGSQVQVAVPVQPLGATRQSGEPSHMRNDDDGSLWWTWAAPSEGTLILEANRGQQVALYRGTSFENLSGLSPSFGVIEIEEAGSFFIAATGDQPFEFSLNFTPTPPAPANDDFANRHVIEPWSTPQFRYPGTTLKATREEGEPALSFRPDGERSIWLEWTAPSTGLFTVEVSGAADKLAIYNGESFEGLVKRENDPWDKRGELRVSEGETLIMQLVDTYWGEGRETSAEMMFTPTFSNDRFGQAIDLGSAHPLTVESDLRGTAFWNDDGSIILRKSGWWKWRAPANGVLEISGDPLYPGLSLIDFHFLKNGSRTEFPASGQEEEFGTSRSFAQVHAGDEVLIRMGENDREDRSKFLLKFHQAVANDNFADATDLGSVSSVTVIEERGAATSEPGHPDAGSQRWWSWTAPATGRFILTPGISAYFGNSFANLNVLTDGTSSRPENIQINAGTKVMLATKSSTFRDNGGPFTLDYLPFDDSNDDLADAKVLPPELSFHLGALLFNATHEPGEPDPIPGFGGSRWWTWTSPINGVAYLQIENSDDSSSQISALRRVAGQLTEVSDTLPSADEAGFPITAGEQYWFRMEGKVGQAPWSEFTFEAFPDGSGPDLLADAHDLGQVSSWQNDFALRQATLEENEPVFFENGALQNSGSLWFTWTAPTAGELTIRSSSSLGYLGFFSAPPFLSKPEERFLSQAGSRTDSVEAGQKLWIGLFKMSEVNDPGKVRLSLSLDTPNPLTKIENAIDLGSAWEVASNAPWFGEDSPSREKIWLKWTAPADGAITLSHTSEIFTGVREEDLEFFGEGTRLVVESGKTYHFQVPVHSSFSPDLYQFGKIVFKISGAAAPLNDDFTNALTVEGNAEVNFDLTGASSESEDPLRSNSDTWYRWVAPQSGELEFALDVPGRDDFSSTRLTAYSGETLESLVKLGETESSPDARSLSLVVNPGETIFVNLGTNGGRVYGHVGLLSFQFSPTVANDSRLNPLNLAGEARVEFTVDNTGASRHPDEWGGDFGQGRPTAWYRWIAPGDGVLSLFNETGTISMHGGDGSLSDEPLLVVDSSQGRQAVTGGKPYLLRYDNQNEVPGKVLLAFEPTPPHSFAESPRELPSEEITLIEGNFTGAVLDESISYNGLFFHPQRSLWYSWTAPKSGPFLLRRDLGYLDFAVWERDGADQPTLLAQGTYHWLTFEAEAGKSYLISALPDQFSVADFRWELQALDPDPNDAFAERVRLGTTENWKVTGHNFLASREEGEPSNEVSSAGGSLWYTWTAPRTGDFLIDSFESETAIGISVFTGNPFGNYSRLVNHKQRAVIRAIAGQTYEISAIQFYESPIVQGNFTLTLEPTQRPSNDNFDSRTVVTSPRPVFRGNLRSATIEADEPIESGNLPPAASVWFQWTAPSNQTIYRSIHSFYVFTSAVPDPALADLTKTAWSLSTRSLSARSGATYYFQITSLRTLATEHFTLDPSNQSPLSSEIVPNDAFEDRIILPSQTTIRTGVDGGGLEKDDREPGILRLSYSGWWSWTAPESGPYLIENQSYGGRVAVFTGDNLESLTEVVSGSSTIRFIAEAGTTYQISCALSRRYAFELSRLDWIGFELQKIVRRPENDDFANALALDPSPSQTTYQLNFLATAEAGEPSPTASPPSRSVWSKWTPNRSEEIEVKSSNPESILAIYTGSSLVNLELVTSGNGSLDFDAREGTSYYLGVDSSEPGSFALEFRPFVGTVSTGNDGFADAVVWAGSHHASEVDAATFSFEDLEPYPAGASNAEGSSWWKWTAPDTGLTCVQMIGRQLHLTIYEGSDFSNLQSLASSDDTNDPLNFFAERGITYFIQVTNRSRTSDSQFRLSLDQKQSSLTNDNFANATPLSGSKISRVVPTDGASFEAGELQPYAPSVWFSWLVPHDGLYRLTTSQGFLQANRGNKLSSLSLVASGREEIFARFSADEVILIALTNTDNREVTFAIEPLSEVANDHFENRFNLGSARSVSLRHSLQHTTIEPGDPLRDLLAGEAGTAWWSWTAPQDGLVSLSQHYHVFTGATLDTLIALDENSILRFVAKQGTTYHLAAITDNSNEQSDEELSLTVEVIANNDFADRVVIPSELPFSWEGNLVNATFEASERQSSDGSAWWEWTASRDGEITFPSGFKGLTIHTGYPSLVALNDFRITDDAPYSVREGRTYYFQLTGNSFEFRTLNIDWAPAPSEFLNTTAGKAIQFSFPFEPVWSYAGPSGPSSIWYSWVADQEGTLTVSGSENPVIFYEGPDAKSLQFLIPHHGDRRSIRVRPGTRYWMSIGNSSARDFDFAISLGPIGDMFENAPSLQSTHEVSWLGTTTGTGWEFGEPRISSRVPERSVWRTWTAPRSGKYRFSVDRFHAGIARGDRLETLNFLGEGGSGTFEAIAGVLYHIVVDSGSVQGDFQFVIAPVNDVYESWRSIYFIETNADGADFADPDHDGRSNLVEMALGSHPKEFSGPIEIWMEEADGDLVLSVLRPVGIEGVAYSFGLTSDLTNWEETLNLAHETRTAPPENGMEIFQVILKNSPYTEVQKAFMRLHVRITTNSP